MMQKMKTFTCGTQVLKDHELVVTPNDSTVLGQLGGSSMDIVSVWCLVTVFPLAVRMVHGS